MTHQAAARSWRSLAGRAALGLLLAALCAPALAENAAGHGSAVSARAGARQGPAHRAADGRELVPVAAGLGRRLRLAAARAAATGVWDDDEEIDLTRMPPRSVARLARSGVSRIGLEDIKSLAALAMRALDRVKKYVDIPALVACAPRLAENARTGTLRIPTSCCAAVKEVPEFVKSIMPLICGDPAVVGGHERGLLGNLASAGIQVLPSIIEHVSGGDSSVGSVLSGAASIGGAVLSLGRGRSLEVPDCDVPDFRGNPASPEDLERCRNEREAHDYEKWLSCETIEVHGNPASPEDLARCRHERRALARRAYTLRERAVGGRSLEVPDCDVPDFRGNPASPEDLERCKNEREAHDYERWLSCETIEVHGNSASPEDLARCRRERRALARRAYTLRVRAAGDRARSLSCEPDDYRGNPADPEVVARCRTELRVLERAAEQACDVADSRGNPASPEALAKCKAVQRAVARNLVLSGRLDERKIKRLGEPFKKFLGEAKRKSLGAAEALDDGRIWQRYGSNPPEHLRRGTVRRARRRV